MDKVNLFGMVIDDAVFWMLVPLSALGVLVVIGLGNVIVQYFRERKRLKREAERLR